MGKNILVIDDEELIIRSLTKLLEKEGFVTFVAKNGRDAITMVDEENFDLIIADIRMPGMDGVETMRSIYKNLEKDGRADTPVIFITGYADEVTRQKALSLNPITYIEKPFDIADLVNKVKQVLKQT